LSDAQAKAIIILENFVHVIQGSVTKIGIEHVIVTKIGDELAFPKSILVNFVVKYIKRMVPSWNLKNFLWFKDVMAAGEKLPYTELNITGKDLAFLQYTGGTTGKPKGAMLTHRNMVANVLQASSWLDQTFIPRKEIIVTALPLYHIFSLTANCLVFLNYGALNVLITNPKDVKSFVKDLKKHKFSAITGVNTLFNLLLHSPEFATVDFSGLKLALGGGMAVQKIVATKWQELTKHQLLEAYGLTETSPAVCINPLNLKAYNGSIGLPVPSTEISVRDDKGNELGFDEPGELCIRGPQVMLGYWQQEAETKNVLSSDGWLKSGDIVTVNKQGFVKIVDRKKDMIIVSGFKIYPNEIEDTLAAMPGVREVAVVGAPDPESGEMVKAFIVKNDNSITQDSVRAYAYEHLTGYKVPKEVEFRDTLPKNNVGKILRRELRDEKEHKNVQKP
jgi:long-chain acyl-CoA synthetase